MKRFSAIYYILLSVAIVAPFAFLAFDSHQPITIPPPPTPGPSDPRTLNHALFSFAVLSVVVAAWISPPWPPGWPWWRFILNSCATPAALNALTIWQAHDDWVIGTMWLFHNEPTVYWTLSPIVLVGTVWILIGIFRMPLYLYRTYREVREADAYDRSR